MSTGGNSFLTHGKMPTISKFKGDHFCKTWYCWIILLDEAHLVTIGPDIEMAI
jgi:hypothetical protein